MSTDYKSLQNLSPADHGCTVQSHDNSTTVFMPHPPSANVSPQCDIKVSLPSYSDQSNLNELPPQYGRWHISQEPTRLPPSTRSIFDRQSVKLAALAVYLLLVYKILTANPQLNPPALNWRWPQDSLMRVHSRDFAPMGVEFSYDFLGQDNEWFRSRLGKLGSYSPLLAMPEMNLFVEEEVWEVEPIEPSSAESDDDEANDEESSTTARETIFENIDTDTDDQPKLPLPLHVPSSLFKLSQDMFNQGMRHLTSPSEFTSYKFITSGLINDPQPSNW